MSMYKIINLLYFLNVLVNLVKNKKPPIGGFFDGNIEFIKKMYF